MINSTDCATKKFNRIIFIVGLLTCSCISANAQDSSKKPMLDCQSLPKGNRSPLFIVGNLPQANTISISWLIQNKFECLLQLQGARLEQFTVSYNCHSRALFDLSERTFQGSRIPAGNHFLEYVWAGDTLVVDCIVAKKKGTLFVAAPIILHVVP